MGDNNVDIISINRGEERGIRMDIEWIVLSGVLYSLGENKPFECLYTILYNRSLFTFKLSLYIYILHTNWHIHIHFSFVISKIRPMAKSIHDMTCLRAPLKLRMCLDGRKWRKRKGRDLKRGRISCLDSKIEGKEFGGEEIGRIWWILFLKHPISPKLERFEEITPISLPFPSIPSYSNKSYFPLFLFPFFLFLLPFPLSLLSKIIIQT